MSLEKLTPQLMAIPLEQLEYSALPIHVALQEAHDLNVLVGNPEIRERLLAVGLPKAELTALPKAIDAAREAQSAWVVVRDRTKNDAQKQREQAGDELRADLVAAARWNLRKDRVAQATIDAIQEGEGVEDLVQDLVDLAALLDRNLDAFAADTTFDASERAELARSTAEAIQSGLSKARLARTQEQAKELRDRAYTYLAARVSAVREAGRYAFKREPVMGGKFGSAYARSADRKRSRKKDVPAEPVIGAPEATDADASG